MATGLPDMLLVALSHYEQMVNGPKWEVSNSVDAGRDDG